MHVYWIHYYNYTILSAGKNPSLGASTCFIVTIIIMYRLVLQNESER